MEGAYPRPILVSDGKPAVVLERDGLGGSTYNENWLQHLLYEHPEALPVAEINAAFSDLIPVCRESSTPAGPPRRVVCH